MNKKYTIYAIVLLTLAAFAGIALAKHLLTKKQVKQAITPVTVNVAKVKTQNLPHMLPALGNLEASQTVTISSVADGRISAIHFKDGQEVAKGMPIVQLDNAQAKADYESALTDYKLAQVKYNRSKSLIDEAISRQELDKLKAEVATKKSAVQNKLAVLNQLTITAPFAGVLGSFKVQQGDYVSAGNPLVTLVNNKQLKIEYRLDENDLPLLKQGQLVQVTTSAYPKKTFYGTVSFISPTVDKTTRTVEVQAMLPNPKDLLKPGMFVHLEQKVGEQHHAMVVPAEAVSADIKGYYVYRLVGNKVAKTYVKVGTRQNDETQIVAGVKPGEVIVTAGLQKLDDGSTVAIAHG
jgi:membrane fusion protein, multidrug efflux system